MPLRRAQFQTKVLVATILVMAVLLATIMYVVNRRFTAQFTEEASDNLKMARTIFERSEQIRVRNQLAQYRSWANEPRVKSLFLKAAVENDASLAEANRLTLKDFFQQNLLPEMEVAFAAYSTTTETLFATASAGSPLDLSTGPEITQGIEQALRGDARADYVQIARQLYEVASVPVVVGEQLVGVLTVGREITPAWMNELAQLIHAEVALIAGGQIAASSLESGSELLVQTFDNLRQTPAKEGAGQPVMLGEVHYLGYVELLPALHGAAGHLLLSSYERPLQQLYATQRMLFGCGLVAIALSSVAVWLIVRKLAQPLRELRDGAEAVGRGDFERQVQVQSADECGQLAQSFNQMTANLRVSRAELEKTLDSLKTTQAQLIQREKLSAIGEFVAGVTHELNNPLTVVIGMSQLLKSIDANPEHGRYLDTIVAGADRCHKIVRGLLSFARQHPPERKLSSINDLVESTLMFVQYELRTSNVEVKTEYARELPQVLADPHQLQQVFLNIVNNARQAMEGNAQGCLRVQTILVDGKVVASFTDTGAGISEANIKKLFTPFFTTKEPGKGTGLGLSVSYGIIQEHGGEIQVTSEQGKGTTFRICLPAAAESLPARSERPTDAHAQASGCGRKILVIDDEESILSLLKGVLTNKGYQVAVAPDGRSGLELLGRDRFDLTVCDWKMPGLNGQQVYQRLVETDPQAAARFVLMTADVLNEGMRAFLHDRKISVLAKPFSLVDVGEFVDRMSRR